MDPSMSLSTFDALSAPSLEGEQRNQVALASALRARRPG
ncbi:hypothetical protein XA26_19720 [Mycolicibacterium fortuitum]|uniref:Uncharacterized protein n=1 Tax=Mycolicibacterium fortuitum TaxID=1766 RepID=A0A0N9YEV1_MYCFO|nr:hypothetical protein XA26_19720 [Mycolicibacterium fortuitum]